MRWACAILSSVAWPIQKFFSTLSHTRVDFREKKITEHKSVLTFSATSVWNIPHSKNNWTTHIHKCTFVFTCIISYSCQILMKFVFSWQIFEKHPNIKFRQNLPHGSRDVPCGRKDSHDERHSRVSQFCERDWKLNSWQGVFMCLVDCCLNSINRFVSRMETLFSMRYKLIFSARCTSVRQDENSIRRKKTKTKTKTKTWTLRQTSWLWALLWTPFLRPNAPKVHKSRATILFMVPPNTGGPSIWHFVINCMAAKM